MKKIYLILQFLASLLLASCIHSPIAEQPIPLAPDLLHIDSLMQSSPDSALQMLLSFRADSVISTEAQRSGEISCHYHSLLLSEALYKTDNVQSNRTELQAAKHCFDSLAVQYPNNNDITMLSARSHYMNGVGYYESDSVVEACQEYLNALEIMEEHFDIDELSEYEIKLMGLTYTRLGELFSNYGSTLPAIDSYKTALTFFSKIKNFGLSNTYRRIGSLYYMNNNIDSASYYYRNAISLAEKQNKITVYGDALSESAQLCYKLEYKDSAIMMVRKALSMPVNEDRYLSYCFTYGLLLSEEHQYDSAIIYLKKSIKRNLFATQTVSAELLMNCYQALGDTVNMQYYKNVYGENLTKYRNVVTLEKELSKIYDTYKQNTLHKVQVCNDKKGIIITSISLLIIFIILTMFYIIREQIVTLKKRSNYDIKEKELAEIKRKTDTNPFLNEPICRTILDVVNKQNFKAKVDFRIYKEFVLDKNQIIMLRDAVDRHYDNFTQALGKKYPKLTIDDIDYCCLYLLGLKDAEISALMHRAYPTVHQRSLKLKHMFKVRGTLQSAIVAKASRHKV